MRRRHLAHGPKRLWLRPWRRICQCGMGTWPCHAVRMQSEQARMRSAAGQSWTGPTKRLPRIVGGSGPQPDRDLMTPGQLARSARAFRR